MPWHVTWTSTRTVIKNTFIQPEEQRSQPIFLDKDLHTYQKNNEVNQVFLQRGPFNLPEEHRIEQILNKDGQIDFNEFLETFRIVDQFGRDLVARRASEDASIAGTDD